LRLSILPTEVKFFDLLQDGAENQLATAKRLLDLMEHYEQVPQKVDAVIELEHRGDFIIHEIMRQLHRTFVTPIDREDIAALGERIDDVVDALEEAARLMLDYKIERPTEKAKELASLVVKCSEELNKAVAVLKSRGGQLRQVLDQCVEINRYENEADIVFRLALAELFQEEPNPIRIMKWRDIYTQIEQATDLCEDAADVLEGIVLKYA